MSSLSLHEHMCVYKWTVCGVFLSKSQKSEILSLEKRDKNKRSYWVFFSQVLTFGVCLLMMVFLWQHLRALFDQMIFFFNPNLLSCVPWLERACCLKLLRHVLPALAWVLGTAELDCGSIKQAQRWKTCLLTLNCEYVNLSL